MKIKHVRKSAEFADIIRNGGKFKERRLTVFFRKNVSSGSLSVGVVISKKTEPLATRRNYMRRVIYSVCDENAFLFRKKTEIVVRVDGKTSESGRKELYASLKTGLESILGKIAK